MMAMGVYAIVCQEADKLYVGSAIDYAKRISQHRTDLYRGVHANIHLQRLHNKYGECGLRFVELEPVIRSTDLLKREQAWLDAMFLTVPYRVVNIQRVAGSNLGCKWRLSSEKAAKAAKGRTGLRRSEATCAKIAESNRGQKRTEESRHKMRLAARNRWQRPDERERLVAAAKHRSHQRQRDSEGRWK